MAREGANIVINGRTADTLDETAAEIRALAVNGSAVGPLQKKGGGTLVKLASSTGVFPVQLIYSVNLAAGGGIGNWANDIAGPGAER